MRLEDAPTIIIRQRISQVLRSLAAAIETDGCTVGKAHVTFVSHGDPHKAMVGKPGDFTLELSGNVVEDLNLIVDGLYEVEMEYEVTQ